jgi:hypothetical protein
MAGPPLGDAGTTDEAVDPIEEGAAAPASPAGTSGRARFDAGNATFGNRSASALGRGGGVRAKGQIETWDVNELPSRGSERTP